MNIKSMLPLVSSILPIPGDSPNQRMIIPIVLIFSTGFAILGVFSSLIPIAIIGLILTCFGGLILLRWPGLGYPLLIVSSLLVPLSISTGTQTRINSSLIVVMGLIVLWLLEMLGKQRRVSLIPSRALIPAFLFAGSALLSLGFGQLNWYPTSGASLFAQVGGTLIMIMSVGAFLVAAHQFQSENWLKATVWVFIILGTLYALLFIIPSFRPYINRIYQRAVVDSLFWTWLSVMAFSQAYLNTHLPRRIRLLTGLATVIILYNLFFVRQSWTSGWLPAGFAIFLVVLLDRPKLAIGLGAGLGLFALIGSQIASQYLLGGDNEYSLLTRLEAWKILGEIIAKNPIFGLGPANYYWYTPFYQILGYSVTFNSHNNYIDIIAQTGLIGLGTFLWFAFEVGKTGLKIYKKIPLGFARAYIFGAIGGLGGTLVSGMFGDWILPFVYNVGMNGYRASVLAWLFLGGLVFLANHYAQHSSK